LYLEKLQLVSQSGVETSPDDESKWNKLAKNVRKANNPLLGDNDIVMKSNIKKLEDNKVEPAVGVLIDFEDKNNSKEEDR
jgi:hypothetical protein